MATSADASLGGCKKIAIMQPYFMPYLGYFQLFAAADAVVIFDDIQYRKKSWINRNRLLLNGNIEYITIDLQKDSFQQKIKDRRISCYYHSKRKHALLRRISDAYATANNFMETIPLLSDIILRDHLMLSDYICHSIKSIMGQLGMEKELWLAPDMEIDPSFTGGKRAIAICKALGADTYINPISGMGLYNDLDFSTEGIDLWFLKPGMPVSAAIKQSFELPSIIDLMMHNPISDIQATLHAGTLHKQPFI
jgi:hypothetical protein